MCQAGAHDSAADARRTRREQKLRSGRTAIANNDTDVMEAI